VNEPDKVLDLSAYRQRARSRHEHATPGEHDPLAGCPFCGEREKLTVHTASDDDIPDEVRAGVYCFGCDANGPPAATEQEAAQKWNARATA
jgi:Lar family restriction alleviation protein